MTAGQAEKEIKARARAVYLGDHLTLARVLGQSKMLLPTTDVGFASHLMLDGFWEIWLTLFFARLVMPGMTVVDVGANFGYYTLLFGHAEGAEVAIIAGMRETIARFKPKVLLEFNAARYEDPSGFLANITEKYRCFRALNFDGELETVTRNDVVTTRYGEDWLLFFEA